jgi:hypothetical protein
MVLQFNEAIGPVIKIVYKMNTNFFNFFVLYFIMAIMLTLIGNLNFLLVLPQFSNFFNSILTVFDTSLFNYQFDLFRIVYNDGSFSSIG